MCLQCKSRKDESATTTTTNTAHQLTLAIVHAHYHLLPFKPDTTQNASAET